MTQISNVFSKEINSTNKYLSRSASSLIIIDSAVEDLEVLKAGFEPGAEVVVLHPQLNGIEQITALVSRRENLQKVHLISHGSPGSLKLGDSELNLNNIDDRANEIETWFGNLGDREATSLFIYGCQVAAGEEGEKFVQRLHQLTNANIAASTQIVGNCDRGGVWQLDYTAGAIDSETIFSQELIETYSGTFEEESDSDLLIESLIAEVDTDVEAEDPIEPAITPVVEESDSDLTEIESLIGEVDTDVEAEDPIEPAITPVVEESDSDLTEIESLIAEADTDVEAEDAAEPAITPVVEADTDADLPEIEPL